MLFIFFLIGAALSVGAWFIPEIGLTSRAIVCGWASPARTFPSSGPRRGSPP